MGDGGSSVAATRVINITSVNDAPTITAIPNQTVDQDTPTGALTFTVGDEETPRSKPHGYARFDEPDPGPPSRTLSSPS